MGVLERWAFPILYLHFLFAIMGARAPCGLGVIAPREDFVLYGVQAVVYLYLSLFLVEK